jgi:FtsP/CotA-like multicopper oxidase with cupredoxin domain
MRRLLSVFLLPALPIAAATQQAPPAQHGELEIAGFEDYREAVGEFRNGSLRVNLETRAAAWAPWGKDGPVVRAHVFALEGAEAKVPGPLLRVTAGTPIHLTLRNTLGDTLVVRGLRDRGQEPPPGTQPGPALISLPFVGDSIVIAPDATAEVRFTPTVPGSYFYFAKTFEPGWSATPQQVLFGAEGPDHMLTGVLIVDAPGEAPDPEERIFLITQYQDRDVPATWSPSARFMINGSSWPHTERLVYDQGDTVRWRIINASGAFHPMHLHGFYFHVDAAGFQNRQPAFDPEQRPLVVTWATRPTDSVRMSWVAREPGNWIFHCHLMRHMSWIQNAPLDGPAATHPHNSPEGGDLMGGLVLGITVRPGDGYTSSVEVTRRQLQLHIGKRPGVFGDEPGYGFVLQEGAESPAADSIRFPGSPIVLTRGEPAEIVVRNHTDVPLGVHWHGIELESWSDGVPGWSGMPGTVVPAVPPGDSLTVRMTPPRAGTFMYHVHSEPGHQLALGLYGAFLVLEPGETWAPDTDRYFLMAALGKGEDPPAAVNGELEPGPMEFHAGMTYRLRFMSIRPDGPMDISLMTGGVPVEWRYIARDGADLPAAQVRTLPADDAVGVGMTRDYLWTPEQPGELTLRIVANFNPGLPGFLRKVPPRQTINIPVRVR